jgi:hypothetical protein
MTDEHAVSLLSHGNPRTCIHGWPRLASINILCSPDHFETYLVVKGRAQELAGQTGMPQLNDAFSLLIKGKYVSAKIAIAYYTGGPARAT